MSNSRIFAKIEHSTNMLFMKKLRHGKDAKELAKEAISMLTPYKRHIKSITTDNGCKFYAHQAIAEGLDTNVYFTNPYSLWQKAPLRMAMDSSDSIFQNRQTLNR